MRAEMEVRNQFDTTICWFHNAREHPTHLCDDLWKMDGIQAFIFAKINRRCTVCGQSEHYPCPYLNKLRCFIEGCGANHHALYCWKRKAKVSKRRSKDFSAKESKILVNNHANKKESLRVKSEFSLIDDSYHDSTTLSTEDSEGDLISFEDNYLLMSRYHSSENDYQNLNSKECCKGSSCKQTDEEAKKQVETKECVEAKEQVETKECVEAKTYEDAKEHVEAKQYIQAETNEKIDKEESKYKEALSIIKVDEHKEVTKVRHKVAKNLKTSKNEKISIPSRNAKTNSKDSLRKIRANRTTLSQKCLSKNYRRFVDVVELNQPSKVNLMKSENLRRHIRQKSRHWKYKQLSERSNGTKNIILTNQNIWRRIWLAKTD